jgi:hypothetical protein
MTNLLQTHKKSRFRFWQNMSRPKKIILSIVLFFAIVIGALLLWGLVNVRAAQAVMTEALDGKASLEYAQVAIQNQEFEKAEKDLGEAYEHFTASHDKLQRFMVYKYVPGVRAQIQAADQMLIAASNLSSGLQKVAALGGEVNAVLTQNGKDTSISDISTEDKGKVLQVLAESNVDLQSVRSDIQIAVLAIENIPEKGLVGPVRAAVDPVREQLPLLESVVTQAIPLAQSLPSILGYPEDKNYLFLLQNNNELRPTGGFIGTYGILNVKNGDIQDFFTDNIYNLDNPARDAVTAPAPGPVARWTTTQNDLMRNINWDPHFPATAVKAQERYNEEAQYLSPPDQQDFDGVIAVTPDFIASLLSLTGPITVEGAEFNSANLTDQLQFKTEFSYSSDGKTDATRKEIIGTLASSLIDQLFGLPQSKFPEIWKVFRENVDQKQILLYSDDPATQRLIVEENWAGEIKSYDSDYLMVIDANLAALKTDKVMKRTLNYTVSKEGDDYYGTAKMEYVFDGKPDNFFIANRYRTHTRFYLPAGAQLVENDGFLTNDKYFGGKRAEAEVSTQTVEQADGTTSTYTVVEGFFSVEAKDKFGAITVKYRLPEDVVSDIKRDEYHLLVQKQAGTRQHGLNIRYDIGKSIDEITAIDMEAKIEDNAASVTGNLLVDRLISIQ